jgi:hypothetical protein
MPTVTENIESSTIEATKLAQEAARRYMDESTAIGRTYFDNFAASAQAGLRLAFDIQNAMIQASRVMMDATVQANRTWLDQTAGTIRKGQDATAKLVATGFDVAASSMPKGRE